jgi:hypothetical protein
MRPHWRETVPGDIGAQLNGVQTRKVRRTGDSGGGRGKGKSSSREKCAGRKRDASAVCSRDLSQPGAYNESRHGARIDIVARIGLELGSSEASSVDEGVNRGQ